MNHKLICIKWYDAEGAESGWVEHDPDDDDRTPLLKTYGLLVSPADLSNFRSAKFVNYASTHDPETGRWSEKAKIPTGMIVDIEVIREVED